MIQTICPKCGSEFQHSAPTRAEQLFAKQLDEFQTAYIRDHYTNPLCSSCLSDIGNHFYAHAVNPRYSYLKGPNNA